MSAPPVNHSHAAEASFVASSDLAAAVSDIVSDAPPLTPAALAILQRTGFARREVPDGS